VCSAERLNSRIPLGSHSQQHRVAAHAAKEIGGADTPDVASGLLSSSASLIAHRQLKVIQHLGLRRILCLITRHVDDPGLSPPLATPFWVQAPSYRAGALICGRLSA
jgi:hypothetical protein